ncbi:MAG: CoA-binding protein [Terriglobia bacterium]
MASHGLTHSRLGAHSPDEHRSPAIYSDLIGDILQRYATLAVVGISPKLSRPSHGVAAYMRSHGYRVIPVNPNADFVLGERCYASLEEVPEKIDIVVIFRKSEFVPPVVESAIRIGASVVWMQEGVTHEEAARQAREAGLDVVEDRCILKEHAKRFVADGI